MENNHEVDTGNKVRWTYLEWNTISMLNGIMNREWDVAQISLLFIWQMPNIPTSRDMAYRNRS